MTEIKIKILDILNKIIVNIFCNNNNFFTHNFNPKRHYNIILIIITFYMKLFIVLLKENLFDNIIYVCVQIF